MLAGNLSFLAGLRFLEYDPAVVNPQLQQILERVYAAERFARAVIDRVLRPDETAVVPATERRARQPGEAGYLFLAESTGNAVALGSYLAGSSALPADTKLAYPLWFRNP